MLSSLRVHTVQSVAINILFLPLLAIQMNDMYFNSDWSHMIQQIVEFYKNLFDGNRSDLGPHFALVNICSFSRNCITFSLSSIHLKFIFSDSEWFFLLIRCNSHRKIFPTSFTFQCLTLSS